MTIFHRLKFMNQNNKGVTLIELLMAMAVIGIIMGSITTAISQVFNLNTRTSNHMIAVRQVQNAGYWVSHDALMAQSGSANTTGNGFPLVLNWTEWDNGQNKVITYTLENASGGLKNLRRTYSIDSGSGPVVQTNFLVGQYIRYNPSDPTLTSCNFTSSKLSFTVTATVGSGSKAESETRKYEVNPRPGS